MQVVTSDLEATYFILSLVLQGFSLCSYCTIFVYVSMHWATVLISNKSQHAASSLWRAFIGVNALVYALVLFLCGESAAFIIRSTNVTQGGDGDGRSTTLDPSGGQVTARPDSGSLLKWDNTLETTMLVLLLAVLMSFLYFGVRIYSRMANIYMLQTCVASELGRGCRR